MKRSESSFPPWLWAPLVAAAILCFGALWFRDRLFPPKGDKPERPAAKQPGKQKQDEEARAVPKKEAIAAPVVQREKHSKPSDLPSVEIPGERPKTIPAGRTKMTEAQIEAGKSAFRKAGYSARNAVPRYADKIAPDEWELRFNDAPPGEVAGVVWVVRARLVDGEYICDEPKSIGIWRD